MKAWGAGRLAAAAIVVSMITSAAAAQEQSDNQVTSVSDWSVFMEDNPKECWSVSVPKETVNTDSNGRIKAVNRGDILLFVYYRPESEVKGQVTFTGGYPFADGSTVNVNIGGTEFEMFTQNVTNASGESLGWAWPTSASDDARIIAAMKRGAEALLTARSSRGTVTKDTFSLIGFTAALDEAQSRCGG
ncbi:invasion associated locus B family protein [Poseidonocella sedimentorum]|uniref:Invasion protein IalB, involved in pathogenesis n=1 Tax=Poseidonocella sedimentorum TaxID=871652 RepID=A0A1I6CQB0_9RHOB|nr:invasion associated locus B family protein [Poseidonocella sedimentorum]SFQ95358.1 hypothetical protein SAMN04515673_101193 [Poseidonocella sedimentorum]